MKEGRSARDWFRERGLETALIVGFVGLVILIGVVVYGFLPKPVIPATASQSIFGAGGL